MENSKPRDQRNKNEEDIEKLQGKDIKKDNKRNGARNKEDNKE